MSPLRLRIEEKAMELLDSDNLHKDINGFTGHSMIESLLDDLATDEIHILSELSDPSTAANRIDELLIELSDLAEKHAKDIAQQIEGYVND